MPQRYCAKKLIMLFSTFLNSEVCEVKAAVEFGFDDHLRLACSVCDNLIRLLKYASKTMNWKKWILLGTVPKNEIIKLTKTACAPH
jgi:hypothetical protein